MTDFFTLHSLVLDPETSPIEAPVTLTLVFSLNQPLPGPVLWKLTYIIDSSGARKSLQLYTSDQPETYSLGEKHTVVVKTPASVMDFSQIKRHLLLNVGLMSLEAVAEGETVFSINMVTHVSRDK